MNAITVMAAALVGQGLVANTTSPSVSSAAHEEHCHNFQFIVEDGLMYWHPNGSEPHHACTFTCAHIRVHASGTSKAASGGAR